MKNKDELRAKALKRKMDPDEEVDQPVPEKIVEKKAANNKMYIIIYYASFINNYSKLNSFKLFIISRFLMFTILKESPLLTISLSCSVSFYLSTIPNNF